MISVPVVSGDTLSGIASSHGVSLGAVESANPQFSSDYNLILVGQTVNVPTGGGGSVGVTATTPAWSPATDGDGDHDGDTSDGSSTPAAPSSPAASSYSSSAPSAGTSSSGGGLSDIPGVPSSFASCVAYRESSDGANQAYNGGVYGIITASGINVNGQSLAAQKAAFSQLYREYGGKPWAADGCPGT